MPRHLARSSGWDTGALLGGGSSGDVDATPGPAAAACAENVDVDTSAGDGTSDTIDGKVGDGNTAGWLSGGGSVLVILLDDDTVGRDARELDVLVGDALDGSGGARDSLDADTVGRVGDSGGGDGDSLDSVVGTASNGSDGETVSSRAGCSSEADASSRVDGEAVILVLADGVGDGDVRGRSDVVAISVVSLR